jgi:hypothetical protein
MSEELQTAFQAVIGVVNYVKTVRCEGKPLKSYVMIRRQNTRHSYTVTKHTVCAKVLHRVLKLKEVTAIFPICVSNNTSAVTTCEQEQFTSISFDGTFEHV